MQLRLPGPRAAMHGAVCGLAGVMAAGAVAATVHPGVYQGGSRKATRHMDIALQVLAGDRRANWRIDVFGPCQHSDDQLDQTVGTDAGSDPPDPQIRLRDGRFTLRHHATDPINGGKVRYVLKGHAVRHGFVGTFSYTDTSFGVTCNAHLLHWRAHRSAGPFP